MLLKSKNADIFIEKRRFMIMDKSARMCKLYNFCGWYYIHRYIKKNTSKQNDYIDTEVLEIKFKVEMTLRV